MADFAAVNLTWLATLAGAEDEYFEGLAVSDSSVYVSGAFASNITVPGELPWENPGRATSANGFGVFKFDHALAYKA